MPLTGHCAMSELSDSTKAQFFERETSAYPNMVNKIMRLQNKKYTINRIMFYLILKFKVSVTLLQNDDKSSYPVPCVIYWYH